MASLHGILTDKKFVPPTVVDGLGGGGGFLVGVVGREGGEYWLLLKLKSWNVQQYVIPYVW